MSDIVLGVDFDNTIVSYDRLFHRIALEKGLIPQNLRETKGAVRDFLREVGNENSWTEMQGYVYGPRMSEALPFPGVLECLAGLVRSGVRVLVISHKTRFPYLGPSYDLHGAAWQWLEQNGFFNRASIGIERAEVFFELTKKAKLERIGLAGCTHYIDDLPEFLTESGFPGKVRRILFDPNGQIPDKTEFRRVTSWDLIADTISAIG